MAQPFIATRREFLTHGLGLVGIGASLPHFLIQSATSGPASQRGQNILVVLQLSGGNDGLSTIVPYANDDYYRNRRTTAISREEVLKVDDHLGFHPQMVGLRDLFDQGQVGIVQGVGYPNPNRSHFQSMDIWHAASLRNPRKAQGWLGRYCDEVFPSDVEPEVAVSIGNDQTPLALKGHSFSGLSLQRPESFRFLGEQALGAQYDKLMQLEQAQMGDALGYLTRTAVAANEASERIRRVASQYVTQVAYPRSPLGQSLQTVAALIAGNLSTRIFYVFQGGYDTHAGQRGRHDRLMRDLSDSLAAFQNDLGNQGNADHVLTMAFSEFGRRVQENGSQGTDHGAAGPILLVGPNAVPGFHGELPDLERTALDRGDLRFQVDFRSVYATVLEKWLKTRSELVLGKSFPLLDCVG